MTAPGGYSFVGPGGGQYNGVNFAPVAGTPYRPSAPLIQGADGSTATPGATAGNQFAGFVSAQGGGFGADPATAGTNQGMTAATGPWGDPTDPTNPERGLLMGANGSDPSQIAAALNSKDPNAQQYALTNLFENASGGQPTATNGVGKFNNSDTGQGFNPAWYATLNPQAQAQVQQQIDQTPGGDPAHQMELAKLGIGGGSYGGNGGSYTPPSSGLTPAGATDTDQGGMVPVQGSLGGAGGSGAPSPFSLTSATPDPFQQFPSPLTTFGQTVTPVQQPLGQPAGSWLSRSLAGGSGALPGATSSYVPVGGS